MQELFKNSLEVSLQLQKAYAKLIQENPLMTLMDKCVDSPLGEYYLDLMLDLGLKLYYWPMFLAGQEDQTTQWFNRLLSGNLCSPGSVSRPMTRVAETPDSV